MNAALAIVGATWRQILGRRRLILFGLLAVFPAVILYITTESSSTGDLDVLLGNVALHLSLPVPVTALILSAAALGAERRDATLSFVVVRPLSRVTIVAAKLAAAFTAAAALNLGGALVLGATYGMQTGRWEIAPIMAGSAVATIVYTAVFVPLGYFAERSTLIGLAYVFIWENGIVGALGVLGATSPWRIGYVTFAATSSLPVEALSDEFALANLTVSAGESLFQVAVFVIASIGLLTWTLRSRDVT